MAIQVYTGEGKGKTTAALGLLLRAVGAGLRVYFGQFLKKGEYSEVLCLAQRFPEVRVMQFGSGLGFVRGKPGAEECRCAAEGFQSAREAVQSGEFDLVVLDEMNMAVHLGLVSEEEILGLMALCPERVELVLTGRCAKPSVMQAADLVSIVQCEKHYYQAGLPARKGIEM